MRDPGNARHQHSRRTDPIDGHSHVRDVDLSFWYRAGAMLEKYRLVVYALVGLLIAFGFDFKTPAARFSELQAQVVTLRHELQPQIDTLKKSRIRQDQMMEFSVRYICAGLTAEARYRLGGEKVCAQASTTNNP